jgi:hypothetical protein
VPEADPVRADDADSAQGSDGSAGVSGLDGRAAGMDQSLIGIGSVDGGGAGTTDGHNPTKPTSAAQGVPTT